MKTAKQNGENVYMRNDKLIIDGYVYDRKSLNKKSRIMRNPKK